MKQQAGDKVRVKAGAHSGKRGEIETVDGGEQRSQQRRELSLAPSVREQRRVLELRRRGECEHSAGYDFTKNVRME